MTNDEKVRQLRTEQGLTQAQLAEIVGVKTATISAWETGRITIRPERLSALGTALGHQFPYADEGAGNSFGEQIKVLRVQRGLSQAEFARQVGVSNAAVSRWERGAVPRRRSVLQQLAAHEVPRPVGHKPIWLSTAFGENLTKLRLKAGLSQKALGQAIGVDDTSISAWETGRHIPGEENLDKLCRYLDITPEDLMRKGK